jgi:hypothetical protein
MNTVLHSREDNDSDSFDSSVEEVHNILGEERISTETDIEDVSPGDNVTYQVGDLEIEVTYLDSGDTVGFLQSYDQELRDVLETRLGDSDSLDLDDKYIRQN